MDGKAGRMAEGGRASSKAAAPWLAEGTVKHGLQGWLQPCWRLCLLEAVYNRQFGKRLQM